MPAEDQLIRTELRFSDEKEEQIIRDEIVLSGSQMLGEYDGMIEAMLPLSSLAVLKKSHILMDFPTAKLTLKDQAEPELMDIPVISIKKQSDAVTKWFNQQKTKAARIKIDHRINKYVDLDKDDTAGDFPGGGVPMPESAGDEGLETIKLPAEEMEEENAPALYKVVLKGPMDNNDRKLIDAQKIRLDTLYDAETDYTYQSFLTPAQHSSLTAMPIVALVKACDMESKISAGMAEQLSALEENQMESMPGDKLFDIAVKDEEYLEKVIAIIESSGQATIIDSGLNTIRVKASPGTALIPALADSPYVVAVSLYEPPTLYCDVSRQTIGIGFANATAGWWGEGETVGVIDSGVDRTHGDLKNRIKAALQYGAGAIDDTFGHGTHVAGIICGDGTSSNGQITGMAPAASVVTLGIVDANGKLDLPVDIGKLLKIVADQGAKIVNLSLGDKVSGLYHLGSLGVDKFIYDNPEILVVVAAGNSGKAADGKLMYKTIGSPATAKNVLTVGASCCRRTTPVINQTWGDRAPANFPSPPMNKVKLVSVNKDLPSPGSSTGPTDFDSIKPEVLAPGTYILAAKAAASNVSASSSEYFDANYTFKTGTSMAAPVVSGLAAVLREFLRKNHNCTNPSSALLKAIIVGSARQIESNRTAPQDTTLSKVGFPDFDQGFGLVDMNKLLVEGKVKLFFADIYNTDAKAMESRMPFGGTTKSYREYEVVVEDNSQDLSVTLCWTDMPAKGIQNNMQMSVKKPAGDWILGNMEHLFKKDPDFDTLVDLKPLDKNNNTEKVLIKAAEPGKYIIKVSAQNTLSRQGYSLAVIGNIASFKER